MCDKPVVAHFEWTFFHKSETFICHCISNLQRFHPICLAGSFADLDLFPFPEEDLYKIYSRRYTLNWLLRQLSRRILDRDFYSERVLIQRKAKLIHGHFGPSGWLMLPVKRYLRFPLVTTFYGRDMSMLAQLPKWRTRYQELFQEGDLFLVEGNHMKQHLIQLGCPEMKVRILRIPVDTCRLAFKPRKPKGEQKVVLLFSGRFTEKKGLIYALKAVKRARESLKNIEFRIVGDGKLREEVERFIADEGMSDWTHLLGFLDYGQYIEELQHADIFIHPSITASDGDSEGGAPTVILDAQAVGLPVLSTYHADIPEVVVPGKSALLSGERDWEGLAKNLLFLLENQEMWEQMGTVGREHVENHHQISKIVSQLEDMYEELIASKGCTT